MEEVIERCIDHLNISSRLEEVTKIMKIAWVCIISMELIEWARHFEAH